MSSFSLHVVSNLFAQGGYVHMGRRFRQGSESVDPVTFGLFVSALLAVLVGVLFLSRIVTRRQAPGYSSVPALFRELCKTHGLDWASRRLLRKLALHQGLENPAQLFLEPSHFEAAKQDGPLSAYRERLNELGTIIFAPASGPSDEG